MRDAYVNAYIWMMASQTVQTATETLARLFAALADPTRLRLLHLMDGREVCVCHFVGLLGLSQPKISRHLAYLRRAGLVCPRREGKWMHYRLETPQDPGAAAVLQAALASIKSGPQATPDAAYIARACCDPYELVSLEGEPIPLQRRTSQS